MEIDFKQDEGVQRICMVRIRLTGRRDNRVAEEKVFKAEISQHPSGQILDFDVLDPVNQQLSSYIGQESLGLHIENDPHPYEINSLTYHGHFTAKLKS